MTENASLGLSGRIVLVVEDEYYIADDITRALNSLGAQVVGPVPTVAEALEHIAGADRIDFAVLDINLQGESVYLVADELLRRRIPLVFTTGYDPTAMPDYYRDMPRWQKPFDPEALARSLKAHDGMAIEPGGQGKN